MSEGNDSDPEILKRALKSQRIILYVMLVGMLLPVLLAFFYFEL